MPTTEATGTTADHDSAQQKQAETSAAADLSVDMLGGPLGGLLSGPLGDPSAGSGRFLSSHTLSHSANTNVRGTALRQVQRSHGKKFVQRALMHGVQLSTVAPAVVQRDCACGGTCASCQAAGAENVLLQRSAVEATSGGMESHSRGATESPIPTGAGEPLGEGPRSLMESRFGRDFSDVRLHTDGPAAESAEALGANAYTSGRDIYFATGRYAPGSMDGQRLLAHELAHTVQQANLPSLAQQSDSSAGLVTDPDEGLEHEAQKVAEQVVTSSGPKASSPYSPARVSASASASGLARQIRVSADKGGTSPQEQSPWAMLTNINSPAAKMIATAAAVFE